MRNPSLAAPLLALVLLAGPGLTPPAAAAIFKCRSTDGHWAYADHPLDGCRGTVTVVPMPRATARRARPAAAGRPVPDPPPAARDRLQGRLQRWQAALRALRATRIPRDPTLARWRMNALHTVVADIATLRRDLGSRRPGPAE